MSSGTALGWLILAIYSAWIVALQGGFASSSALGAWTPELGIAWFLAIDARARREDAWLAALLIGCARAAFTSDPMLAVCVGYGALAFLTSWLRRFFEVDGPIARALIGFVGALAISAHWTLARSLALANEDGVGGAAFVAWPFACSSALAALALTPLLARLPGLSALWKRRRSRDSSWAPLFERLPGLSPLGRVRR